MPLYSYADRVVFSTFPLAGLLPAIDEKEEKSPNISFELINSPLPEPINTDWIHHWYTPTKDISISLARTDNGFLLRFPSLADFVISKDGEQIVVWPASGTDDETLRHLLLDQVLPRVLSHQGQLVLHASAVRVEGQAIAFVGETGWGKSTLAASLYLSGYPLLTDDCLLIGIEDDCIKAIPSYPGLRLLPQSIEALFKESSHCTSMASYSEKNRMILSKNNQTGPVELAALFVIGEPDVDDVTNTVKVSPLSQRDACMELVRNSFQLDVSSHDQATTLFAEASAVVERLPLFSLSYPHDFSCLPKVHEVIFQQFHLQASKTFNSAEEV